MALVLASSLVACAGGARTRAARANASAPPPVAAAPAPITPVPETLAFEAGRFGLTMAEGGWTWKVLRRNLTRFDWAGRSATGDREVLYAFFVDKLDEPRAAHLPQLVLSAAANLSEREPCPPVEQPPEVVRALGVDRVITVCFEPSTFYGSELRVGVLHGIVHGGALTLAAMLSNDPAAGLVPRAAAIGTRGTPSASR